MNRYGWKGRETPPTNRSRRAGVFGLTALFAVGAACGGGGGGDDKTDTAAETTTTTLAPSSTTTTAAKVAASVEDLSRLLLTKVPAGYNAQPDDVGNTGPSDLDKAVSDDGGNDARAVLTRNGFVRGYQRLWQKSDDEQIIAFLYQFNDNAGAADYGKRTAGDLSEPQEGITVTPFDVPGIEGAVAVTSAGESFSGSVVIFTKGPYLVQLVLNGVSPAGQAELVRGLAADQFSRL